MWRISVFVLRARAFRTYRERATHATRAGQSDFRREGERRHERATALMAREDHRRLGPSRSPVRRHPRGRRSHPPRRRIGSRDRPAPGRTQCPKAGRRDSDTRTAKARLRGAYSPSSGAAASVARRDDRRPTHRSCMHRTPPPVRRRARRRPRNPSRPRRATCRSCRACPVLNACRDVADDAGRKAHGVWAATVRTSSRPIGRPRKDQIA